jgi:hypothetical protein
MKDGDVIEMGELNVLVKVLMRNEAPSNSPKGEGEPCGV